MYIFSSDTVQKAMYQRKGNKFCTIHRTVWRLLLRLFCYIAMLKIYVIWCQLYFTFSYVLQNSALLWGMMDVVSCFVGMLKSWNYGVREIEFWKVPLRSDVYWVSFDRLTMQFSEYFFPWYSPLLNSAWWAFFLCS